MDAWIREIFAASPGLPAADLPTPGESEPEPTTPAAAASAPAPTAALMEVVHDWESQVEMQRLLDLLPMVQTDGGIGVDDHCMDIPSALGLELCGEWNFGRELPTSTNVGVF